MTIRVPLGAVLAALLLVAVGAAGAVGVLVWEPWGGDDGNGSVVIEASPTSAVKPTQTPYQKRLTGPEAAAIVNRKLSAEFSGELMQQIQQTPAAVVLLARRVVECEATDFNEPRLAWIVECQISRELFVIDSAEEPPEPEVYTTTYRLYDATQKMEPVGP